MRKLSMDELNRLNADGFAESAKLPVVAVLDNIRSLHNIGSFFRTADAFRIEAIYLCGITACPPHREIQKTALGATETVRWQYFEAIEDALLGLKKQNYLLAAIEQTTKSHDIRSFHPTGKTALIFGNEVDGVDDKALHLCDLAVEIPQAGTKHSLNVAVCGGIVLWHCFQRLATQIV